MRHMLSISALSPIYSKEDWTTSAFTCSSPQCSNPQCPHRHPRPCKYFALPSSCYFGSSCSFSHVPSIPSDQTPSTPPFSEELTLLHQQVTELNSIISDLSKRLDDIVLSQSQTQPSQPASSPHSPFPCDHCEYSSSTSRGLKSHMTKKHKQENLREDPYSDTSDITLSMDHRSNPAPSPSIPLNSMDTLPPFPCYYCDDTFQTIENLGNHINETHNLTNPCPHCGMTLPANEHILNHHRSFCTKLIECPGSPVCGTKCHFNIVAGGGALFWRLTFLILWHECLVSYKLCYTVLIVSCLQEVIILAVDNKWWWWKIIKFREHVLIQIY